MKGGRFNKNPRINDDEEEPWGDADNGRYSDEGEFQDLNPSESKKRVHRNTKERKEERVQRLLDECEIAEKDPVKRRMLANGQHVPVRMQGGENMNINVQYDDGQVRKFGQAKYFDEKLIPISRSGTFIYEAGDKREDRVTGARGRDDTRSMFDDPELQKLRSANNPKILQKLTNRMDKDEGDGDYDPAISWKPVKNSQEIPQSYYMKQVFEKKGSGPRNIDQEKVKSEYDAFRLFFDDEIYEQIIRNTRERYQQKVEEAIYAYIHGFQSHGFKSKKPNFQQWEFTDYELEAYFAVQIFFGIVRLSNQRDYWKSNARQKPMKRTDSGRKRAKELALEKMDRYSHWVTQRMNSIVGYERFKTIRSCLNISGAEALKNKGRDPIWKIRDFLGQMNQRFQKFYYPGEFLTIDEGMIPFAGKVQFKVYNPDKPCKWGIKEYLLCDANSTYTFQVKLHHGHTMWTNDFKQTTIANEDEPRNRTMELVLQLLKDYEQKAHKVVMDNYYSSWQLFRELRNRNIGAVGTIRHNRTGLTKKDITSKHFQQIYNQYHYAFYLNHSNELMLMYFQGTSEKEIALMSNFLDNSLNESHMWDISKQHYYTPHPKAPYLMYIYNKYKGGVDRRNSYVVKYRSRFPAKKWWQSVFERLFETAILNAYIIFKSYNPESVFRNKGMMRDFRINLMYQFAERYKAYEHQLEDAGKRGVSLFAKMQPHTFIEGEEIVRCSECGNETKTFCSECTILKAEIIGLCSEKDTVKCQRFHEFMDFDIDKTREYQDKRKKSNYIPDYYQKLNQRTNTRNNQDQDQKQETPLLELLTNIQNQVKQEQQVKQEPKQEHSNILQDQILQKIENISELNSSDNETESRGEDIQIEFSEQEQQRFEKLLQINEEEDEDEDDDEDDQDFIADHLRRLEIQNIREQSVISSQSNKSKKQEKGYQKMRASRLESTIQNMLDLIKQ